MATKEVLKKLDDALAEIVNKCREQHIIITDELKNEKEENKSNIFTVSVNITDSDEFNKFYELYRDILEDERIDEAVREEHREKLNQFFRKFK